MLRERLREQRTVILICAWAVYFLVSTPISYGTGIVSTQIVLERGWSEGLIGLSGSLSYAGIAVFCTVGGLVEQQRGFRSVMLTGSLLGMAAYLVMAGWYSHPAVYLAVFSCVGVSSALSGLTSGPGLVNAWFGNQSMMPMAILLTAGSFGGFVMPVVSQLLVERGIEACWLTYAGMCGLAFLIELFLIRDKGKRKPEGALAAAGRENVSRRRDPAIRSYYRSRTFAALILEQFGIKAVGVGINSYIVLYAIQSGVSGMRAAALVTAFGVMNFVGRLGTGYLGALPFTKRQFNMLSVAVSGAGCLVLWRASAYPVFLLGAGVAGFGFGIACTLRPILVASCFGSENFPIMNGTVESISTIGSVVTPMLVYGVAELCGGYAYSYLAIGLYAVFSFYLAYRTDIRRVPVCSSEKK